MAINVVIRLTIAPSLVPGFLRFLRSVGHLQQSHAITVPSKDIDCHTHQSFVVDPAFQGKEDEVKAVQSP